jgi:Tol biopolymer transport system component
VKTLALALLVFVACSEGAAAQPSQRTDGRILFVPLATTTEYAPHAVIRAVDTETGATTTVAPAKIDTEYPTPSPDGRRLAFTRGHAEGTAGRGLFVAGANGRHARRIASPAVRSPTWSPDGSRLAYVWDRVAIRRVDGRLVRRWPLLNVWQVAWSPRGSQLAVSRGAEAPSLQLVRPDGRLIRTLRRAAPGEAFLNPQWSPDGRSIIYDHDTGCANERCAGAQAMEIIDLRGHVVQSLGYGNFPVFSPTGTKIAYYYAGAGDHGIFIRSLADGSTRKVFAGDLESPAIGWQAR